MKLTVSEKNFLMVVDIATAAPAHHISMLIGANTFVEQIGLHNLFHGETNHAYEILKWLLIFSSFETYLVLVTTSLLVSMIVVMTVEGKVCEGIQRQDMLEFSKTCGI